ncbi:glutathione S-transferase N-terminal domain-containing protein [Vibrio sp. Y2-5]|uniref:glutathione S-transferase family protein n=1 Tax=Vibrio TaxID=662 RepID=UPI00142D99BD|nr:MULTISPECIES: glutathione S-transferase N-terminal domain-containing protein [Vibrio]MBD0788298.1 glutathione S-transferase N-terminal domain-containing protein [Vibrio sp. Y2-5]NIY91653.1 glutathione S-transferase family protein [Vibrio diazotrophicus]
MEVVFYSAKGSNSAERVEWALNYKQIPYQRVDVTPEAMTSSFLKLNPIGFVPAIAVDGFVLSESMAIIEYLEECFDGKSLLGSTPQERANIRRVCEYVNSTIHSPQNKSVLRFFRPELDESSKRKLRGEWICECLEKLKSSICIESNFAVGANFSLADIFVASIYKKALQHGSEELAFFSKHLSCLRSVSEAAMSEPS